MEIRISHDTCIARSSSDAFAQVLKRDLRQLLVGSLKILNIDAYVADLSQMVLLIYPVSSIEGSGSLPCHSHGYSFSAIDLLRPFM
jgi:hypothetical protein